MIAGGVVGVVALSLLGFGTWAALNAGGDVAEAGSGAKPTPTPTQTEPEPSEAPTPTEPTGPIRMLAMGEMVAHESVSENAKTPAGGYDFAPLFAELDPLLGDADATFCAQPIPSAGVDFGIAGFPQYNAPTEFATTLSDTVGCDLVSLAGPNAADRGADGIRATLDAWQQTEPKIVSGTNRTPEEQRGVQYGEVRGVKTALVSFTERLNQVTDAGLVNFVGDTQLVTDLITEARANADVVLVAANWGEEGTSELAQRQRNFAQLVSDLGADMILGTGSHVIQPVEWLDRPDGGRTLVWYSLGSLMGTPLSLPERIGAVASVELVPDGEGWTVANPSATLTYLHYAWTPEQQAANELLARTGLKAVPLAGAQALLDEDRWGTTVQAETERIAGILGPDVAINAG
ncbi:CapA family protein [Leucobacter sp. M11]|nr:CapA family protein [Leucobacter sp. M11]